MRFRVFSFLMALVLGIGLVACPGDDNGGGGGGDTQDVQRGDVSRDATPDTGTPDTTTPDTTLPDMTPDTTTPDVIPDITTQSCGDVTYYGECDGDTLRWCREEADELVETDCATGLSDLGVTGTCALINSDYGYDCVASTGDPCFFVDEEGPFALFCDGTTPGCVLTNTDDGSACMENLGDCGESGAVEPATCSGQNLVWFCQEGQSVATGCDTFGGTCSDTDGACINIPADGPCDDEQLLCADGLTCTGVSDTSLGTCTAS